jgi:hypothetical protein
LERESDGMTTSALARSRWRARVLGGILKHTSAHGCMHPWSAKQESSPVPFRHTGQAKLLERDRPTGAKRSTNAGAVAYLKLASEAG